MIFLLNFFFPFLTTFVRLKTAYLGIVLGYVCSKTYSMSLLTLVINCVCYDLISDNFYHPDGGKDVSNLFPMHGQ